MPSKHLSGPVEKKKQKPSETSTSTFFQCFGGVVFGPVSLGPVFGSGSNSGATSFPWDPIGRGNPHRTTRPGTTELDRHESESDPTRSRVRLGTCGAGGFERVMPNLPFWNSQVPRSEVCSAGFCNQVLSPSRKKRGFLWGGRIMSNLYHVQTIEE